MHKIIVRGVLCYSINMSKKQKYWFSHNASPPAFRVFLNFPVVWQGWATLGVYIFIFPLSAFILLPEDRDPTKAEIIPFAIIAIINTVVYIVINQLKTDPKTK
jgi:hypothetical protein